MGFDVPLISPLSRKYYNYALEKNNRKHYRAEDIRICLEYICDEIIFEFISENDKANWNDYDLHAKLKASKSFLNKKIVHKLIEAKIIGNKGVHTGEEGDYSEEDIEKATESIRDFSLEIFFSYFKRNGFDIQRQSWVPTVFSTLPPVYRVEILEKYYTCNKSTFVIDKLSKAYLKNGLEEKAKEFLSECHSKNEITEEEYDVLVEDVFLLKQSFNKLPIANDLEAAKDNFNRLLSAIGEEERDCFVCLVSMILNGYHPR